MMAESGTSYWSVRRRIRKGIAMHLKDLRSPQNTLSGDNTVASYPDVLTESTLYPHQNVQEEIYESSDSECSMEVLTLDESLDPEIKSDSDMSQDSSPNTLLLENLKEWAINCKVPDSAVGKLLRILHPYHPHLPKDPRILKKTTTQYDIKSKCGGEYFYFGIVHSICHQIKDIQSISDNFVLSLQINVDGLPLFKSTGHNFWPIVGRIVNIPSQYSKPFIIALYSGTAKPSDINEYFHDFIDEFKQIQEGFPCHGKRLFIAIHSIICDTPARAFVKNVKSFSGYHGCDKCIQAGKWVGKMTFPETNATVRTDISFDEIKDEDHHMGPTPLSQLNIGMVSCFPLDYMHLVCLGVVKRLLNLWIKGPLSCRLGSTVLQEISRRLVALKDSIPSEFARKPRPLFEIAYWKATEFRQFLLYTGPISLCEILPPTVYQNFMILSVSMHILLNQKLCTSFNSYAHELMVAFVKQFLQLYGPEMAVYNVHGLVHLALDAKNFGSLENVSAFPFENFLQQLKHMVRKPSFPVAQVVRRMSEIQNNGSQHHPKKDFPMLSKSHCKGPLPDPLQFGSQFGKAQLENFSIDVNVKDSCIRVNGKTSIVKNIVQKDDCTYVVYQCFKYFDDFFNIPLPSSYLGIGKVFGLESTIRYEAISKVEAKCVLLPFKDKQIVIPYTDAVW
ncbi:uncharacterized protein LOC106163773 [Lingula anatina]|uniref:Uncharacterized protein LOC106163773 n=1 Tax=Lingula anatina TaxID=7574 RepID=A0A1S3IGB3_LINAN|nr:uncharacterized protein LOC106163773 [Lingula anatina]|eukprot:XP_013396906.1 uncharacterized protein LOC106163773 [Lingula anatina]